MHALRIQGLNPPNNGFSLANLPPGITIGSGPARVRAGELRI